MEKQTAKEVVEASMPNMEVIGNPQNDNRGSDSATESKLSMPELYQKFLGEDSAPDDGVDTTDGHESDEDEDVEVVQAKERFNADSPVTNPVGIRTFIVSKGHIKGSRG